MLQFLLKQISERSKSLKMNVQELYNYENQYLKKRLNRKIFHDLQPKSSQQLGGGLPISSLNFKQREEL